MSGNQSWGPEVPYPDTLLHTLHIYCFTFRGSKLGVRGRLLGCPTQTCTVRSSPCSTATKELTRCIYVRGQNSCNNFISDEVKLIWYEARFRWRTPWKTSPSSSPLNHHQHHHHHHHHHDAEHPGEHPHLPLPPLPRRALLTKVGCRFVCHTSC